MQAELRTLRENLLEDHASWHVCVHDPNRTETCHYSTMGVAPPKAKEDYVSKTWLLYLTRSAGHEAEVSLLGPVHVPVCRIGSRIERFHQSCVDEHANQQHSAVHSRSHDVGIGVVRSADPPTSLGNNSRSLLGLGHATSISGCRLRTEDQ